MVWVSQLFMLWPSWSVWNQELVLPAPVPCFMAAHTFLLCVPTHTVRFYNLRLSSACCLTPGMLPYVCQAQSSQNSVFPPPKKWIQMRNLLSLIKLQLQKRLFFFKSQRRSGALSITPVLSGVRTSPCTFWSLSIL